MVFGYVFVSTILFLLLMAGEIQIKNQESDQSDGNDGVEKSLCF